MKKPLVTPKGHEKDYKQTIFLVNSEAQVKTAKNILDKLNSGSEVYKK